MKKSEGQSQLSKEILMKNGLLFYLVLKSKYTFKADKYSLELPNIKNSLKKLLKDKKNVCSNWHNMQVIKSLKTNVFPFS